MRPVCQEFYGTLEGMIVGSETVLADGSRQAPVPSQERSVLGRFLHRGIAACRSHWSLLGGIAGGLVFATLLSSVLSDRYWAFQTYAWDLGGFNQGMWTTTFADRLLYYTADLPSGNTGSLLGTHFTPFLFLLVPFYSLWPNPAGLLVLQSAGLAAGVVPLYFLSRRLGLSHSWILVVQACYLATPALMGIGWYDFHAEAFLPVTVLLAVYCYYFRGKWAFAASWILCLSVIETVAPLLFLFALGGLIAIVHGKLKHRPFERSDWPKALFGMGAALGWVGVALLINEAVVHTGISTLTTTYAGGWSVLGPNLSLVAVVPYALSHPSAAAAAILTDGMGKLMFILLLFGSFAFLSLLGPKRLLFPAVGWLVLVVLSNGESFVLFGDQYSAYGFAFVAAGFPFGLARLLRYRASANPAHSHGLSGPETKSLTLRPVWRRAAAPTTASALAAAVIVTLVIISPLQTNPSWTYDGVAHGFPVVSSHDLVLHQVIGLIPTAAGVLTGSTIFPEISSRVHAYVDPISTSYRPNLTYVEALNGYVNDSQFVLLDFSVSYFDSAFIVNYADLSGFGIRVEEDQIVLYERGWTGPPQIWVPVREEWCGGQLGTTDQSFIVPSTVPGCSGALRSVMNPPLNSLLWYGPYDYGLPPGEYAVTYWLSVMAQSTGGQIRIYTLSYPLRFAVTPSGPISEQHTYSFIMSSNGNNQTILNETVLQNPGPSPRELAQNVTLTMNWSFNTIWGVAGWVTNTGTKTDLYEVTLQQTSTGL